MTMLFERFWLGIGMIFLGSCAPIVPPNNTSITIYTDGSGRPIEQRYKADSKETCQGTDAIKIHQYKKPQLPDFKTIPDSLAEDEKARRVNAELVMHIKTLRQDIDMLLSAMGCSQKTP